MRGTVSTPASRAMRQARDADVQAARLELALLGLASLLFAIGVALVLTAKTARATTTMADVTAGRAIDLNTFDRAEALVPFLVTFDDRRERRVVASAVLEYVRGRAGARDPHELVQVGDLARVRLAARDLERRRDTPLLAGRIARLRAGRFAPDTIRVLDADDLRALRPAAIVRTPRAFTISLLVSSGLLLGAFLFVHAVRRRTGTIGDPIVVPAVYALCGIGLVTMVSVNDPLRDRLLFESFAGGVALGSIALIAASQVDFRRLGVDRLAFVFLAVAIVLSVALLLFGSGPGTSGVKVNLLGMQPVELIRPLVAIFLAGYFARRWEFLRELQDAPLGRTGWMGRVAVPRLADLRPVVAGMALVLLFFFFQRDLGPALVISCVFLASYSVARGRWVLALLGLSMLVAGFAAGYWLGYPSTVVRRIAMWRSPWDNGVPGGDQVAQALWALASGGIAGRGAGRSGTGYIPTGENDLVLASIGEDLGFIGLVAVVVLFGVFVARALRVARRTDDAYLSLLVVGLVVSLAAQAALIAGGLLGLLPLSGVVTPFLSAGRSSMISNLAVVGLILAAGRQIPRSEAPLFARPVRTLSLVAIVVAAAVLGKAFYVQVAARADTMGRPVRTRQADGATRFQDNPRLREVAQLLTRGTIADRNGLPLATSDRAAFEKLRPPLAALGLPLASNCPDDAATRCYPFGGSTFHLLGDAVTRVNWGASNTQFVEREMEATLRGFGWRTLEVPGTRVPGTGEPGTAVPGSRDQSFPRASDVPNRDAEQPAGDQVTTTVPNYGELLPLWDHRDDLSHPDAQRLLTRSRDVRLTVDARLQARVARLLADRIERAKLSRGAVVVIDVATGEVLATVSYPWPVPSEGRVRLPQGRADSEPQWLDRARFGQYPPGSTFKLVTASAALLAGPDVADRTFVCRRIAADRVGNVLAGWRRPVRDDPTDHVPHGEVSLEEGLRVSCNAYFGQLGVAMGARRLKDAASQFGILASPGDSVERLRGQLPWASYGQAEVLASPITMARVAATFANQGVVPAASVLSDGSRPFGVSARVLPREQAARIARAMRTVVTSGTAHGLTSGDGDANIAGKTGTAEVTGAPSHSWFVGFAPASPAGSKAIAFAVIVENGGYGASVAVPLAGDVVAAAQSLGLVK